MPYQLFCFALAQVLLGLVLVWRVWLVFRPRSSILDHPVLFFALVSAALLLARIPVISWAHELNVDESQLLAQAMRFLAHPVPWRDVDGTTCGPLDSLVLTVPLWLGAPATWLTARIILWASHCLGLFFLYKALRPFGSRAEVQFVLLPTILFYGPSAAKDFVSYANETPPVLLLSLGAWLLSREWTAPAFSSRRSFLLGLLAGAIPFAKLQAGPLALLLVVVGLAGLACKCRVRGPITKAPWAPALSLCLGALTVTLVIPGIVAVAGAFGDFWISYILVSLNYAKEASGQRLASLWTLFGTHTDFTPFLLGALLALGLFLGLCFVRKRFPAPFVLWPLVVSVAWCALTVACLATAGYPWFHYLNFLVPPLTLARGLAWFAGNDFSGPASAVSRPALSAGSAALQHQPPEAPAAARPIWWPIAFTVLAAFQLYQVPSCWDTVAFLARETPEKSYLAEWASKLSRPGDTLSVWGWMPTYYVETGLVPASRESIGVWAVSPGPYQAYFRNRYLADLRRSRPAIFIDAVAPGQFLWTGWTSADHHESFPELAQFIETNYTLGVRYRTASNTAAARLYISNDRFAWLQSHSTNSGSASPQAR